MDFLHLTLIKDSSCLSALVAAAQLILADYGIHWTAAVFVALYLAGSIAALLLPRDTKGTALEAYTLEDDVTAPVGPEDVEGEPARL